MLKVPVEKHGKSADLRQKGKIAELALGCGGSIGALKSMGALEKGLQEKELQSLVTAWREANPHITAFWRTIDDAVRTAIQQRTAQMIRIPGSSAAQSATENSITISHSDGMLFIRLPSGRHLSYIKPKLEPNPYGSESVTYMGQDAPGNGRESNPTAPSPSKISSRPSPETSSRKP